jgi:putative membrane protein
MQAENFFTTEEKEKIRQAVMAAERRSSGEVVPLLVAASARYAEIELAGSAVGLVVGTLAALLWTDPWGWSPMRLPLLLPALGAGIGFVCCGIPAIKRRLIPKQRLASAVHLRSLAAFTAHGLHYTRAHTGILILASLLERRVEVLADRGIHQKVRSGTWDEVVEILTRGLKSSDACSAFCMAIGRCGEILAQHFPRPSDDRDELENRIVTDDATG